MDTSGQAVEPDASVQATSFFVWWNSDWGPGPLIRLALPLMISAGFVSLTLFTDRMLLYWHSDAAASAATGAGTLYWSAICLPLGMLGYISTFVSQYRGAQRPERVGAAYQHAMVLAWLVFPLLLALIVAAPYIFAWADHNEDLARLETSYLQVLLIGGVGVLIYTVQSGVLTGRGRTAAVLAIDAIGTVVNLILDFVLIFGWGPIPELGILGAAIATSGSFWLKVPLASWVVRHDTYLQQDCQVSQRFPWERDMFRRLFVYGAPAGLQMLAEAGCFTLVIMQVGSLGELPMAATTLALGLNVLGFIPMIGLGIGVGVMVGQHLTEGRIDLAKRSVTCGIGISVIYTSIFAILLLSFPEKLISIYAWGTTPERFETMQPLLSPLLRIIAIYCILDGLQVVFVGAIKGAGDTWFVLLATFVISVCAVFSGIVCQEIYGPSLLLWWYVIAGWVTTMGIVFASRYAGGRWESKRVIEST